MGERRAATSTRCASLMLPSLPASPSLRSLPALHSFWSAPKGSLPAPFRSGRLPCTYRAGGQSDAPAGFAQARHWLNAAGHASRKGQHHPPQAARNGQHAKAPAHNAATPPQRTADAGLHARRLRGFAGAAPCATATYPGLPTADPHGLRGPPRKLQRHKRFPQPR